MKAILEKISSKVGSLPSVVFCDAGYCEMLKWYGTSATDAPPTALVLALSTLEEPSSDQAIDSWMKKFKPLRGIFLISTPILDVINIVKKHCVLFNLSECIILTSSTVDSTLRPNEVRELEEPYAFAKRILRPTKTAVLYFPLHIIPIMNYPDAAVELFALSSPACRTLFPLTINSLDAYHTALSIHHIEAAELPYHAKVRLRCLAHELAGALVHDLNVAADTHIFALGKTSSLLGHSMQPIMTALLQQRIALDEEDHIDPRESEHGSGLRGLDAAAATQLARDVRTGGFNKCNRPPPPITASLLLLDRTEDLFTPSSHSPSPLAHRILSTLPRTVGTYLAAVDDDSGDRHGLTQPAVIQKTYPLCDVDVCSAVIAEIASYPDDAGLRATGVDLPLAALSSLPYELNPSICGCTGWTNCDASSKINELYGALYTRSEEDSRAMLVSSLKDAIVRQGAKEPPPKKRGYGAEILAYTQALMGNGKRGIKACVQERELLAICGTVIESMQRSASKAAAATGKGSSPSINGVLAGWQCSFEVKAARERALDDILQAALSSFAECVPFLLSFLHPEMCSKTKASESSTNTDPCMGPPDVAHLLTLCTRAASLLGLQGRVLSSDGANFESNPLAQALRQDLQRFFSAIGDHICSGRASAGELNHLVSMGLLPAQVVEELSAEDEKDEWADEEEDDYARRRRIELQMADVTSNWHNRVMELASSLRSGCDEDGSPTAVVDMLERLKRVSKHDPEGGTTPRLSDDRATGSDKSQLPGVAALTIRALVRPLDSAESQFPPFEHIETPLQQLKRAGLGLLSQGLSFFGTNVSPVAPPPSPRDHNTVILFVLGGISFRELMQIRQEVDAAIGRKVRIIVGSNRLVAGEDAPAALLSNTYV